MAKKNIRIKNFLIYMPTIVATKGFLEMPTGLKIRGLGVKLMFGGPGTQILGGGVEMSNGMNRQLFRMDLGGTMDPGHGHPGGIGSGGAVPKAGELDISTRS